MEVLTTYLRSQAEWRDHKAFEYPDDQRNEQSACALRSLADYIEDNPDGLCDISVWGRLV